MEKIIDIVNKRGGIVSAKDLTRAEYTPYSKGSSPRRTDKAQARCICNTSKPDKHNG